MAGDGDRQTSDKRPQERASRPEVAIGKLIHVAVTFTI